MPKIKAKKSKPLKETESSLPMKSKGLHVQEGFVYVEKGVTKNMGDFNSTRVTVGITLPLNPTEAQIKAAQASIDVANEILDAELEAQVNALIPE